MSFVDELNYAIEHADQINDEAKICQTSRGEIEE